MEVKVFDRTSSAIIVEEQYKARQSEFLYNTVAGRVLLKFFIASRTFSRLNARSNSGRKSIKKIAPFIEKYKIEMSDFEQREYTSFNDFFARKTAPGKRPFAPGKSDLIAVADAKLSVYAIDDELKINIKNSVYTVEELTKSGISGDYKGGLCLVFRLTVDDYHRYCFFDSGRVSGTKTINGCLHTVGPISAKRYKVYSENYRNVSLLKTDNFGDCVFIEVGALLVGKIVNHPLTVFNKGDEKGYFLMGGSTIVILLKSGIAEMDSDILLHAGQGIETKVKMGEKIGGRIND